MDDAIQTARELATHEADIAHLQTDMDKLIATMEAMQKTVSGIEQTLAEAKGGWKVLMMFGGAGGFVGAILTQLVHNVFGGK